MPVLGEQGNDVSDGSRVPQRIGCTIVGYSRELKLSYRIGKLSMIHLHLRPFQETETFGYGFDVFVIINYDSNSNEYLVILATQSKES
jgi:hypothetical protein